MDTIGPSKDMIPEELFQGLGIVEFITGKVENQDHWAYVIMDPLRYVEYYRSVHAGIEINLEDFGDIVEFGTGLEPPQEIQKKMKAFEYTPELKGMMEEISRQIDMSEEV